MATNSNKISKQWIPETRDDFRVFLDKTGFSDPEQLGERYLRFTYPKCLIMSIVILSVGLKKRSTSTIRQTISTLQKSSGSAIRRKPIFIPKV